MERERKIASSNRIFDIKTQYAWQILLNFFFEITYSTIIINTKGIQQFFFLNWIFHSFIQFLLLLQFFFRWNFVIFTIDRLFLWCDEKRGQRVTLDFKWKTSTSIQWWEWCEFCGYLKGKKIFFSFHHFYLDQNSIFFHWWWWKIHYLKIFVQWMNLQVFITFQSLLSDEWIYFFFSKWRTKSKRFEFRFLCYLWIGHQT